jgi:hypothetical protein
VNCVAASLLIFAEISLCSSDRFESEFLWPQIEPLKKTGELDLLIQERTHEIQALNEYWRPFVASDCLPMLGEGSLMLQQEGASAAYVLYDSQNNPRFVIKPNDENIFCLNNPKHFASPFLEPRAKPHIPLYKAAQTDAACYEMAKVCGLEHITPKTVLALISHPQFSSQEEKLCSIQEYVKATIPLRKVLENFFKEGFSEEELLESLDQEDFEDVMLFLWLTFDSDAHIDNFLAYPKRVNHKGATVYGILKIDNSLALPESNSEFSNPLMYLPHAFLSISSRIREKILALPLKQLQEIVKKFGLDSSLLAFEERISSLQKLVEDTEVTYEKCSISLQEYFVYIH